MTQKPHVVILGAGFAGVAAMQALRRAPAKVTLVDRNDYHTFQPLLYQAATALADLLTMELKEDYPNLPVERAQVRLYEAGPRLLGFFKPRLQEYAMRSLTKRGVRVHLGEGVVEVEPTRVHLRSGAIVPAHTLVWGAGLQPSPVVASLGIELTKGRAPVGPDLSLRDHPEVFVAGDIAMVVNARTMQPLPQLGSVAKQAGSHVGFNIARLINGERAEPFVYRDRGIMGANGRGAAVAELPLGITMTGYPAWWMWLAVHLMLLAGGEGKFLTVLDWIWGLRMRNRSKRIVVE